MTKYLAKSRAIVGMNSVADYYNQYKRVRHLNIQYLELWQRLADIVYDCNQMCKLQITLSKDNCWNK